MSLSWSCMYDPEVGLYVQSWWGCMYNPEVGLYVQS